MQLLISKMIFSKTFSTELGVIVILIFSPILLVVCDFANFFLMYKRYASGDGGKHLISKVYTKKC